MERYLKYVILLICSFLYPELVKAQDLHLLQTSYQPSFPKGSIQSYFDDIRDKTGVMISYSSYVLNGKQKMWMHGNEQTIADVLHTLLDSKPLNFIERGNKILIVSTKEVITERAPVDGYIRDKLSREILIGANIYFPELKTGAVTNSYGFYSISIPPGVHTAYVSYLGYKTDTISLEINGRRREDIMLMPGASLKEVNVVSDRKNDRNGDYSQLSIHDVKRFHSMPGDNDAMRALQLLPGVQCAMEGTSAVQVRGGDPGQNLNMLDGVPLFYVDHLFGLTSVYNPDAIKSVDLYKGAFPARYGGRISSIIDVHTKDGDMQEWGGQYSMGLTKAALTLEGPIIKDKSSIMVSGRRTWIDGLTAPFYSQVGVNFYDINAKANYIINDDNRIYASVYNGRDEIRYSPDDALFRTRWGNTIASVKWNSILNPKLFLNTIFTYSLFQFELKDKNQVIDSGRISDLTNYIGVSSIRDFSLQVNAEWFPNPENKVQLGSKISRNYFVPTEIESIGDTTIFRGPSRNSRMTSNELSFFIEDEVKLSSKVSASAGIHWANWYSNDYLYPSLQPRLSLSWKPRGSKVIYGSFSHMSQFLHLINNNTYGLPTDFWVPSTKNLRPEESWQGTLGYSNKIGGYNFNVEGYYKYMDGMITYNSGKTLFDNSDRWQDKVIQGRGWSYGAEFSADKRFGPLTTRLAYTLSWSWRQFDAINNGDPFPYRYDRRHNIRLSANYKVRKGIRLTANWMFMSGEAFTLPDQVYPDFDNNLLITQGGTTSTSYTYHYSTWNDYRLPAIHRLDLGAEFVKVKKRLVRTWSVGVLNAYARKNVMFVMLSNDVNNGSLKLQGLSFLQFVPYVTFQLKF